MPIVEFLKKHFVFIPLLIFVLLISPFLTTLPYLDGNIDFVMSEQFYRGGVQEYISGKASVHPPLKMLITASSYSMLGVQPLAYTLPWLLIGIFSIAVVYKLGTILWDETAGRIASLLLALYPLFLANALFGMTDFLLSVWLLCSVLAYAKKNYLALTMFLLLVISTKETGMILVGSFIFVEISLLFFEKQTVNRKLFQLFLLFLPVVAYLGWGVFLSSIGSKTWNDWNFSSHPERSATQTIFFNLMTGEMFNKYAAQHWKQLFLLNANWLMIAITFAVGIWKTVSNIKYVKREKLKVFLITHKPHLVLALFAISYSLTVLTFQTYTIPRYTLPVGVVLVVVFSGAVSMILSKRKLVGAGILILTFVVMMANLFASVDPLARRTWGKITVFDQPVYDLPGNLSGSDGIAYNYQFFLFARERSNAVKKADGQVLHNDCYWIFPDKNNDLKMITAFGLEKNVDVSQSELCKRADQP